MPEEMPGLLPHRVARANRHSILELYRAAGVVFGIDRVSLSPILIAHGEAALQVRVSKERKLRGHALQRRPGIAHRRDVLVLVQWGTVRA